MRSHLRAASAPSTDHGNSTFSLGVIAAMLVCAAAFLGIGAPAASAAPKAQPTYSLLTKFYANAAGAVFTPEGVVALDSNGNIFLADEFGERVHVYSPETLDGAFISDVGSAGTFPTEVAVDLATDDLFVQEAGIGSGTVKRYTSDGNDPPAYTVDAGFSVPAGGQIAVDQSSHDLLVADAGAEAIRVYDTTGLLTATIATPGINPSLLAVAADGSLFVSSGSDVLHLSSSGSVLNEIEGVGQVTALAIEPTSQNLVINVNGALAVYTSAGSLLSTKQASAYGGIAIDSSSGRLYASNIGGGGGGEIFAFVPAVAPGVEPPSVSAVTTTGFHLETEVDPGEEGGGIPSESAVRFEYRTVGDASWTSTPSQEVNAAGSYGADVSGLLPHLEYEVRAVASNSLASFATAPTKVSTLTGPPVTDTASATDVTETSAVLNGTINPLGLQTSYYFEYGTTTAYGSRIPVGIEAVAGGGRVPELFSRTITGLTPGTTYHFRLVATNSEGTTQGPDRSFTTVVAGGIPFRVYEQVTPVDKKGAAILPRLALQASADGNGLTYTTKTGSDASPILSRSVALRGSSDWQGKIDTDPQLNATDGALLIHPTLALSGDYRHALVVSNRVLTPEGGFEQGANIYVRDLISGTYQLIGASNAPRAFNNFAGASSAGTFMAGAPDFSWIIFASPPSLLPGVPRDAIYRWSGAGGLEVISTLPNGDPSGAVRANVQPVYHTVSADGSRIYYSAAGGAEEGVFMRDEGGAPKPISVSHVPGDPTTPQWAILLGITPDGRYAFFTSDTKLTSDAPGEKQDLYRYDAADESLEYLGANAYLELASDFPKVGAGSFGIGDDGNTLYFISTSFGGDKGDLSVWHEGVVHTVTSGAPGGGEERSSTNGRYTVFTTSVGATGGVIQLYDVETNETSCVSCLPDGTPVSATLPENTMGDLLFSNRSPLAVDDIGTVYFDTPARLVAADVNGTRDVYTYRDGILRLISPGNRPFEASYADATADGSNVFFTTAQKLVGRDNDESIDIYDARVNGGLPAQSPPPPQECLRDDCKATPNAGPELPFGGSEALSGPENVKPTKKKVTCGKGKRKVKVKGKVKCVKKHKAGKNKKGGNR